MYNVLIIGATRGLGLELAKLYASKPDHTVWGTSRSGSPPEGDDAKKIKWITDVDLMKPSVGKDLVKGLAGLGPGVLKTVIITAGYFTTETFEEGPSWEEEIKMYSASSASMNLAPIWLVEATSSIAPPFIVHALYTSKLLTSGSKILLVTSESGSITLRHHTEGGGNYGHHGSKAASNMVGKLLSLDLAPSGVIVSIVHPGFMKTEMTKGVGFDQFYEDGGAVEPSEAAGTLIEWAEGLTMEKSGEYWAVRGPGGIGTAEHVLGKDLEEGKPLFLPW